MINWIEKGYGLRNTILADGHWIECNSGVWSSSDDAAVQLIIDNYDPLPFLKREAKDRLIKQSQVAADSLTYEYPEFEIQTWVAQEREALAWQSNDAALTPTVDIIASQRGIDRLIILPRILAHAEIKLNTAAKLAGERQRLESIIDNSTDLVVIESISFVAPVI